MKYLLSAALIISAASFAQASSVTYSTIGTFSTTGTNMLPVGGGTLVFDNLPTTTVTTPGNLSYGTFDSTGISNPSSIPAGETFTLTTNETAPGVGTFANQDSVTGTITPTGSTVSLMFATTTFSIAGTNFAIAQDPVLGIRIVAPNDNNGITTIQGTVNTPAGAPEPATMALVGGGLLGFGLLFRRKRA